uniref:Uncharacterized protein n=1 Tax=Arundo donax TaxID=35708 RepID=A0A0A9CMB8_ARUDO
MIDCILRAKATLWHTGPKEIIETSSVALPIS